MYKSLIAVALAVVMNVSLAMAGDLSIGAGQMNGHSNAKHRCTDKGVSVVVGYDDTLYRYGYLDLRVGALLTYGNFQTAYRYMAADKSTDKRRETLVNLSTVIKPTVHIGPVDLYYMAGVGYEYFQPDGLGAGWTHGAGISYQVTDRVAAKIERRLFYRNDTGFNKHTTLSVRISF